MLLKQVENPTILLFTNHMSTKQSQCFLKERKPTGFFISGNVYSKINRNVWHIIKVEPVFLMTKLHLLGSAVCSKLVPLYQDDSLIWLRTCPRQKIKCRFYPGQLLTSDSFQFTRKTKPEERPQKWAIFQRSQVIRNLDQLAGGEWVEKTVKVTRERLISG